jgi:hypothetical protein
LIARKKEAKLKKREVDQGRKKPVKKEYKVAD